MLQFSHYLFVDWSPKRSTLTWGFSLCWEFSKSYGAGNGKPRSEPFRCYVLWWPICYSDRSPRTNIHQVFLEINIQRTCFPFFFFFPLSLDLWFTICLRLKNSSIPSLLPTIQDRLLECISLVLTRSHRSQTRASIATSRGNITSTAQQVSELSGSALIQLALQTLARFNFKVGQLFFDFFFPLPWYFIV